MINGDMSKILLMGIGIKVDSGEQFRISFKGTVKKTCLGMREISEIFLGDMGTQTPQRGSQG